MTTIIKPSVMNILCSDPAPINYIQHECEHQPKDQAEPKSLWARVRNMTSKIGKSIKTVIAVIGLVSGAIAAFTKLKGFFKRGR